MPANSQFHKIISILLIFILMTELSGCGPSGKLIQSSVLPLKAENGYRSHYDYIIFCPIPSNPRKRNVHIVENISVSNGYLAGDLAKGRHWAMNYVFIDVPSDSLIKVSSDKTIKIALDDISKVEVSETNYFVLGYVCAVIVFGFTMIIISATKD